MQEKNRNKNNCCVTSLAPKKSFRLEVGGKQSEIRIEPYGDCELFKKKKNIRLRFSVF
jgi:hypothetical protein